MATDCIYRKTNGSASVDCADFKTTGAISPAGNVNATGAGYFTGGVLANGSVVASNGTAPTLPASVTAFFGSGGANHAIVFPTAIGMQGRMLYVYEAGSGTTTATGYGTQNIGDSGTQAYTPGKYGLYISTGAHWNVMIESV